MSVNRREFLKSTSVAAGLAAGAGAAQGAERSVSIIVDPADSVAAAGPAKWAIGQLEASLASSSPCLNPPFFDWR
jgi:putative AlgH/UPF0301 family transcriptional regulator